MSFLLHVKYSVIPEFSKFCNLWKKILDHLGHLKVKEKFPAFSLLQWNLSIADTIGT